MQRTEKDSIIILFIYASTHQHMRVLQVIFPVLFKETSFHWRWAKFNASMDLSDLTTTLKDPPQGMLRTAAGCLRMTIKRGFGAGARRARVWIYVQTHTVSIRLQIYV